MHFSDDADLLSGDSFGAGSFTVFHKNFKSIYINKLYYLNLERFLGGLSRS